MRIRTVLLFGGVGIVAFTAAVFAQDDPIKQCQDRMKAIGDSMKILGGMAKGTNPYDADAAKAALARINESIDGFTALFPKGPRPAAIRRPLWKSGKTTMNSSRMRKL